ncbi:hypothetical protein H671_6g15728 [Cricetulus griseus]|nr:hypothetical protein H671_6g15728 [Cricetulus griseus]
MESVERNQVGSRVVRGWEWASPTVQLGPLQKVVLQSYLPEVCKWSIFLGLESMTIMVGAWQTGMVLEQ